MRPVEPIRQRVGEWIGLVERISGLCGEGAERGRVQIRPVVALGKTVDEDVPVALQLRLEAVHLMWTGKRIALDAVGKLTQIRAQRLAVVRVEVDEDEAFP